MSGFDSSMMLPNTNSEVMATAQRRPEEDFFKSIRMGCFPNAEAVDKKAQPWKDIWTSPTPPSAEGEMLVACPKNCVYGEVALFNAHTLCKTNSGTLLGSSNLGGL